MIMKMKKLLIIGCGRSGTAFSSALFQGLSLDIPHEKVGKDGISSWYETIKDKEELINNYSFILHQVRDPLKVIASTQTLSEESWKYISDYIPIELGEDIILRCAKYWYYWNLIAEKKAHMTLKVEEIFKMLPEICKNLDIEFKNLEFLQKESINTRNGRFQPVTWEDIKKKDKGMHDLCLKLAKRYGYHY